MSQTPSRRGDSRPTASSPTQGSSPSQNTPKRPVPSSNPTSPSSANANSEWAALTWVPPPQTTFRAQLKYKADLTVLLAKDKGISVKFAREIIKHVIDTTIDTVMDNPSIRSSAAAMDGIQHRIDVAQGKKSLRGRAYGYIIQIIEETGGSFYAALIRHQSDFEAVSAQLGSEIAASTTQRDFQLGANFGNLYIAFPPPSVVAANRAAEDSDLTINEEMAAQYEVWEAMARQGED